MACNKGVRWQKSVFPWLVLSSAVVFAQSQPSQWLTIRRADFCVTDGALKAAADDRILLDVPEMRAYVKIPTAEAAEIRFRYDGPTKEKSHLGSGQVRSQFGLKLRAQDPCNLVYAIWRVEPKAELVVSVKRNPTQHTSAQCHNHGYTNIKPEKSSPVPPLKTGESHTLRGEMNNADLRVFVDNHEVWEGSVGADAASLKGPVGIRSDNVQLEFEYQARRPPENVPDHTLACTIGESD